jgi:CheY-like chemotaxis protein
MACQSHQPSDPTKGEAEPAWRPRILWADDDADTRDRVRQLLGDQYEVEAVTDGEAALAAARARPPDLLLCDAMIPRLDGLALLSALRNEPRTRAIPVILLSARADEESRVKSFEAGANDYVVKPFSARELLARVGSHIEMVRSRREADERVTRIMESIPDGLVIHDREWRYTWINSPAERLLGRPRSELLGKRVWDEFPHTVGLRVRGLPCRLGAVVREPGFPHARRRERRLFPGHHRPPPRRGGAPPK